MVFTYLILRFTEIDRSWRNEVRLDCLLYTSLKDNITFTDAGESGFC